MDLEGNEEDPVVLIVEQTINLSDEQSVADLEASIEDYQSRLNDLDREYRTNPDDESVTDTRDALQFEISLCRGAIRLHEWRDDA